MAPSRLHPRCGQPRLQRSPACPQAPPPACQWRCRSAPCLGRRRACGAGRCTRGCARWRRRCPTVATTRGPAEPPGAHTLPASAARTYPGRLVPALHLSSLIAGAGAACAPPASSPPILGRERCLHPPSTLRVCASSLCECPSPSPRALGPCPTAAHPIFPKLFQPPLAPSHAPDSLKDQRSPLPSCCNPFPPQHMHPHIRKERSPRPPPPSLPADGGAEPFRPSHAAQGAFALRRLGTVLTKHELHDRSPMQCTSVPLSNTFSCSLHHPPLLASLPLIHLSTLMNELAPAWPGLHPVRLSCTHA